MKKAPPPEPLGPGVAATSGPWPWYLLAMEALGMATISLLYIRYVSETCGRGAPRAGGSHGRVGNPRD
jgi:hypothetical protein